MSYFERAILAAALTGVTCGFVGALVLLRRRTFFAQALTHATYPGAVVAAACGWAVPVGAAMSAIVLVGLLTVLGRLRRQGTSAATGIVLTGGFALGTLLQASLPGLPVQVESFLFGSILTVTGGDLTITATVLVVALVLVVGCARYLVFATADPTGYRAAGYRAWPIEALVLAVIAMTVVAALPAVGAILAIALIAAPAAAVRRWAPTFGTLLLGSAIVGGCAAVCGVLVSRSWDVPAGPAITLIATGVFVLSLALPRRAGAAARGIRAETVREIPSQTGTSRTEFLGRESPTRRPSDRR
ncbi:MAG: hypothetical protein B5766_06095 [Candidatus Lumbricidophila eiseniae]|uniref:Metal ABC transporter permease n=1 Tax=Candidatus Lumbricidiphila eiseniae TaxID=1969409 RepID=A0A2A6FR84_9MICO|nr:MAG: hypothetical protein B5766_06095 [Candidatus Lumbricidophila eiseniae]